MDEWLNKIVCMDALEFMRGLPDNSVNCCVTSPPYYGLRDYGADGQIGLEDTPAAYVARLVALFDEVRRVLREDGVCWINLGDSYAGAGYSNNYNTNAATRDQGGKQAHSYGTGLKPKDLIGIPWRTAFALQDAGWYLRAAPPWIKANPMPESVTDRPTTANEYVFLLAKSPRYWFDADAVRVEVSSDGRGQHFRNSRRYIDQSGAINNSDHIGNIGEAKGYSSLGRNRRTSDFFFESLDAYIAHLQHVREHGGMMLDEHGLPMAFNVNTQPSPFPHFAMFPQALIEPMILAGCPAQVCSACGAPYVREVERHANYTQRQDRGQPNGKPPMVDSSGWKPTTVIDRGFSPTCDYHAPTRPGIVIDPFMGAGTTAIVSQRLGRNFTGCDISAEYVELARRRVQYHGDDKRMMAEEAAGVQQLELFGSREASDANQAKE